MRHILRIAFLTVPFSIQNKNCMKLLGYRRGHVQHRHLIHIRPLSKRRHPLLAHVVLPLLLWNLQHLFPEPTTLKAQVEALALQASPIEQIPTVLIENNYNQNTMQILQ